MCIKLPDLEGFEKDITSHASVSLSVKWRKSCLNHRAVEKIVELVYVKYLEKTNRHLAALNACYLL